MVCHLCVVAVPIGFSGGLGSFEESWPVGVWDVPHPN